jgi:hypothetical protein
MILALIGILGLVVSAFTGQAAYRKGASALGAAISAANVAGIIIAAYVLIDHYCVR